MEETISLQRLVKVLRKRLFFIISMVVLTVTIAGVVSYYFMTPIYEASTQILINQKNPGSTQTITNDVQTNLELINTYNVIIKSPVILSKVIENLNLTTTPDQLNSKITVNHAQNSQVVNIVVQDSKPNRAVDIANMTVEVFQKEIRTLMKIDNVNILSPAVYVKNEAPIKPQPIINMAIAAIVGMMLGIGIAFLLDYLNTTVKTEQDIVELLGLPIFGLISPISDKDVKDRKEVVNKRGGKRGV